VQGLCDGTLPHAAFPALLKGLRLSDFTFLALGFWRSPRRYGLEMRWPLVQ